MAQPQRHSNGDKVLCSNKSLKKYTAAKETCSFLIKYRTIKQR